MSQTIVDGALPPRDEVAPPRLVRPRREAVQMIVNHIKLGQAIASQRMVYVDDLQQARREKQEWVTRTAELLEDLFGQSRVMEQVNDYVGPILPEYEQVDLFIEQFTNEMKHRIGQLHTLAKRIGELPEAATVAHIIEENDRPELIMRSHPILTARLVNVGAEVRDDAETLQEHDSRIVASALSSRIVPAGGPVGLLVLRSAEESLRETICRFFSLMDICVHVIDPDQTENLSLSDLLEPFDCQSFAIILDDAKADQGNNLFNLGCCVGRFGSRRVCVLHGETPGLVQNDSGVLHIMMDSAGAWQLHLARHLKAGGATIDLNRLA